jgi:hypothetical protein
MIERRPMSPAEFDAACRRLEDACPDLSQTSGKRTEERNARVGGNPLSKHTVGMARDYVTNEGVSHGRYMAVGAMARVLGLWFEIEDDHIHVQGLPPGEVPGWWLEMWLALPDRRSEGDS